MGSGQMGETHSPIQNMFKINGLCFDEIRWGPPLSFSLLMFLTEEI
jgi:hypothetical protein